MHAPQRRAPDGDSGRRHRFAAAELGDHPVDLVALGLPVGGELGERLAASLGELGVEGGASHRQAGEGRARRAFPVGGEAVGALALELDQATTLEPPERRQQALAAAVVTGISAPMTM